jgi:TatD DNase family protein
MLELVDTHVHLDDARYDADREAVIVRSREAGVVELVTIATHLEDSRWVAGFVAAQERIYGTVGHHPELADRYEPAKLGEYRALAKEKGIVAIGEVGLDFHRPEFRLDEQEPLLRDMCALARDLGLPLVVHNRGADAEMLRILKEVWDPALGGVFHCFAGSAETAKAAMDLNFDIAVGGVLTFKNAQALREVIATVPLQRLLLETDGPWLAPQAWRGRRNEPAYLVAVAQRLAELKGVGLEVVAAATTANARRVFRLKTGNKPAEKTS